MAGSPEEMGNISSAIMVGEMFSDPVFLANPPPGFDTVRKA
jgi:hypothetical protein